MKKIATILTMVILIMSSVGMVFVTATMAKKPVLPDPEVTLYMYPKDKFTGEFITDGAYGTLNLEDGALQAKGLKPYTSYSLYCNFKWCHIMTLMGIGITDKKGGLTLQATLPPSGEVLLVMTYDVVDDVLDNWNSEEYLFGVETFPVIEDPLPAPISDPIHPPPAQPIAP